jgi:molybdopterin-guanine dinucleotide biosynthesis protein A
MGGKDKAWLEVDGIPMIQRVLAAAQPVVRRLGVVINTENANIDRYRKLSTERNIDLVLDHFSFLGPMGGIHTGFGHSSDNADSLLILACDLPFLTTDFLFLLAQLHKTEANALTIPLSPDSEPQPLAGIYGRICQPIVDRMLREKKLKLREIFRFVPPRFVRYQEYAHLPGASDFLRNINSPDDLPGEHG